MAGCTWESIVENGWFDEIKHLYGKEFPWEIRSTLSSWFARDDSFMSFDISEPNHHQCILAFTESFLKELVERILTYPSQGDANFFYRQRLKKLYKRVKAQDRQHLFQIIKDTLTCEKQRVEELKSGSVSSGSTAPTTCELERSFAQIREDIDNDISRIQEKCSSIENAVPDIRSRYTTLQYNMYMLQHAPQNPANVNGYIATPNNTQQTPSAEDVRNDSIRLNHEMQAAYTTVLDVKNDLTKAHSNILNELEKWRDEQRLVALGKPGDKKLESIEKWCKIMANCFEILDVQLPSFIEVLKENRNTQADCINNIQGVIDHVGMLRRIMIDVCLVVSKEAKQIVRTGPNIGPVQLLVLPFCTNMMITSVKAVFINEKSADEFFNNGNNTPEQLPASSGDLKFGKGNCKITNNRIEYQTMTVSKVKKSSKRGEQFVVEERFFIYFRVTASWQGRPVILHTTSLPISVTSHPVQEGKAWTHILWYLAFPMKSRLRFQVPNEISWALLIEAINLRFINLGRSLSPAQKNYLKDRLFRGPDGDGFDIPINEMVTKSRFCCETFATGKVDPETSEDGKAIKNYSFGEWLFCCLKILSWAPKNAKLAKYGLKYFWKDGKIEGFMSKQTLESLLKNTRPGTFIIRFPENMPDHLALYFYKNSATPGDKLLKQLLTIKDFNIRPLQDRILDSQLATYLYPNIDKEEAFTKSTKVDTSIVNGYITVGLKEYIPSSIRDSMMTNSFSPSSSHSFRSIYPDCYSALSPSESVLSDHSSASGSYNTHSSPESATNNASLFGNFSPASLVGGIDLQIFSDDNDINM